MACMCIFTLGGLSLISKEDYGHLTSNISPRSTQEDSNKKPSSIPTPQSLRSQTATLFGQIAVKPQKKVMQQLPETRLNLILTGTFTHEDSDKASALIAENHKNTARFFVGDEIPGNAELIEVRKGEVTLRRNGQDELLKLPYLKADNLKSGRVAHNKQRQAFSINKTNPLTKNSQMKSNQNTGSENTNSRQQQLKDRLARLRNNDSNRTSKN